jgi:hypothetical protein
MVHGELSFQRAALICRNDRKRCELPRRPGGYERVLKRVGIQY